jgi:cell division protein FtsN
MLKLFFWALLLTNGVLFAYHQGYLDTWFTASREPARLSRQLNADQIRLLPADAPIKQNHKNGATPTSNAEPATATTVAAAPASVPAAAEITPEMTNRPPETIEAVLACTEIGNFNEADASRFETQLATLALGQRVSRRVIQENGSYIIFMPPQDSKENAEKKIGQLRRLGVTDFYLIQDNSDLRWGISLGLFSTQAAAEKRLAQLNEQGVRSARIGLRTSAPKVAFQFRDLDAAAKQSLDQIKADFPQQQMRNCA